MYWDVEIHSKKINEMSKFAKHVLKVFRMPNFVEFVFVFENLFRDIYGSH